MPDWKDMLAEARNAHAMRWQEPGPTYPQSVPAGVVHLGDWASEELPGLIAEVERLHSWNGLMSLLDEHYPESVFPTLEDDEGRDVGPRIVSLLRRINHLRGLGRGTGVPGE